MAKIPKHTKMVGPWNGYEEIHFLVIPEDNREAEMKRIAAPYQFMARPDIGIISELEMISAIREKLGHPSLN